jgi:haloalkane dehalogenase
MTEPTAGVRPPWVDDELFPFESRFVEVDGHTVHHVDEGSGPTLLMLHGAPTWSFVYRLLIEQLRGEFRCVALDYPGFGLSTAAEGYGFTPEEHAAVTASFVEALDLRGVTLVVHDWGGPIGVAVLQAHPDRVDRVVLGNTWGWPVNGDPHFELFSRVVGGPVGRELIRRLNLFVNVLLPVGHQRRELSAHELQHYRDALSTRRRRHANAVFPLSIRRSRAFLQRVQSGLPLVAARPALIVWGDSDLAFRSKERRRWQALLPQAPTVVLRGAGHFLPSDAPEEMADAIRRWWPGD